MKSQAPTRHRVMRGDAVLGIVRLERDGWRFYPWTDARKPSRRGHQTVAAAIPAWVGEYKLVEITTAQMRQDASLNAARNMGWRV